MFLDLIIPIFILSIPVFYIMGAIKFFSLLSRNKSHSNTTHTPSQRQEYLNNAIQDLQTKVTQNPSITAQELLQLYRQEVIQPESSNSSPQPHQTTTTPLPQPTQPRPTSTLQQPISNIWGNWYSNNSINLILYIGAFFILASASIFIGVQWDTLSVYLKVMILGAVTLVFLASGITFHHIPKIKQAGVTFTAIGALLIPLTGISWINSSNLAIAQSGAAWVIVALLTLLSYLGLFLYLRASFYVYLSSLASISLALSFITLIHGASEMYLLAGMLASFVLLLGFILQSRLKIGSPETQKPMQLTAQVVMPLFILFALYTALTQNLFATTEAVISLLISTLFYGICYTTFKQSWQLLVALILGILTAISWSTTIQLSATSTLTILNLLGLGYLLLAARINRHQRPEESQLAVFLGLSLFIATFVLSQATMTAPVSSLIFILMAAGAPVVGYYAIRNLRLLYLSLALIGYGTNFVLEQFWNSSNSNQLLIISYVIYFLICYTLVHLNPRRQRVMEVFGASSLVFFILSILIALGTDQRWLLAMSLLLGSSIMVPAWQRFRTKYAAMALFTGLFSTLAAILYALHTPLAIYPPLLSLSCLVLYWLSIQISTFNHNHIRATPVVLSLLTSIAFFLYYLNTVGFNADAAVTTASLISAYISTALLATEAYKTRNIQLGYTASAFGLATYLWQLSHLGISELQVYTASMAIYFLALAWIQNRKQNLKNQQSLEAIGLFLLIVPTTLQSLISAKDWYFILQLGYGLVLVAIGISTKNRQYLYAGIASLALSIIIKSYAFILLMPKWLLIGILGVAFLILGVYLLTKRREEHHDLPEVSPSQTPENP